MAREETLQDQFLRQLRLERIPVTVFLVNGFQIRGVVMGCDSFSVFMMADGKQEMIYKHAIPTIIPMNPVKLP